MPVICLENVRCCFTPARLDLKVVNPEILFSHAGISTHIRLKSLLGCNYLPFYRQENPRFHSVLSRLEEDPICQRLPLTSFLILPFQRITRLKMLVEV